VVAVGAAGSLREWQVVSGMAGERVVSLRMALFECSDIQGDTFYGTGTDSVYLFDVFGRVLARAPYRELSIPLGFPCDGVMAACDGLGKWGFVSTRLKWVAEPQFDWLQLDFSEGEAWFGVAGDGRERDRWGFVSRDTLAQSIPPQFAGTGRFRDGLAPVAVWGPGGPNADMDWSRDDAAVPEMLWGYIDHSGSFVVKPRFEFASEFSCGFAVVSHGGRDYFIDSSGLLQGWGGYYEARPFQMDRAAVRTGSGWGFVDACGAVCLPCEYDYVWDYSGPLALTNRKGRLTTDFSPEIRGGIWTYVTRSGDTVFTWGTRPDDSVPFPQK
jgi:hypothetical protein